ncbi:MAG: WXG100 family type VII secretion target [Chloroflexota bacterium]
MSEIRVNYETMIKTSGQFDAQAQVVEQIMGVLTTRTEQLTTYWESVAEETFMQELQASRTRLTRVSTMLASIGQALKQTAANFEQAENEAAAITNNIITADD